MHRGLLPFRVWQIFDEMVRFAKAGKVPEFVCAAGVMTHYLGDACQPLHISYLHDGDPERPTENTVHHKNGTVEAVKQPLAWACTPPTRTTWSTAIARRSSTASTRRRK